MTLFSFLGKIISSKTKFFNKCKLVFHGFFYLVPVTVFSLIFLIALHLFFQFSLNEQLLIFITSFCLSFIFAFTFIPYNKKRYLDVLFTFPWFWSLITIAAPYLFLFFDYELYHYLVSFPYSRDLAFLKIALMFTPLFVVLLTFNKFGIFSLKHILILFLSYPIFLFLDIYACLLGFFDFLRRATSWGNIKRSEGKKTHGYSISWLRDSYLYKSFVYLLISSLTFIAWNDLTARDNCGEPKYLFSKPIIFNIGNDFNWLLRSKISASQDRKGYANVSFKHSFSKRSESPYTMLHYIDGQKVSETKIASSESGVIFNYDLPFGWSGHEYVAKLVGEDKRCVKSQVFVDTVKAVKGRKLFVNGEEFLVKGVIPSFSSAKVNLDYEKGIQQIKSLGANVIRLYHEASDKIVDIA